MDIPVEERTRIVAQGMEPQSALSVEMLPYANHAVPSGFPFCAAIAKMCQKIGQTQRRQTRLKSSGLKPKAFLNVAVK